MDGSGTADVSVVLPAYDEENTIETTVRTTIETLEEFLRPDTFEVLIAEDGCTDQTPAIADQLAQADSRVQHFHSDERLGRGGALERAFEAATGGTLAYLDTDLATDMQHLERLITTVQSGQADVATGSRWIPGQRAERPRKRGIPSRGFNLLVRGVLGSNLLDHQCGFKAVSRGCFDAVKADIHDQHWFWDTELLVRAQRAGFQVDEFPVSWEPHADTKVDLVRDVLGMGSQIVRLWWQVSVQPRLGPRTSFVAGLLLVTLAAALMTQYLDASAVAGSISQADPLLIAGATLLYALSWPLRGFRYRDILAKLGFRERVGFLTGAVFISQTGNLVFPARGGDAVRAYIVKMRRTIPYPSGLASLAAERIFDLLTITTLAGTVLLGYAASGELGAVTAALTGADEAGRVAALTASAVGFVAVTTTLVVILSARSERNRVRSVLAALSSDSYTQYVAGVIERFVGDLQQIASSRSAFARVGATSLVIWLLDVLVAGIVLVALDVSVPPVTLAAVCVFAVSVGNLAKVLPLSPGGIGLYEGAFSVLVVGLTPLGAPVALGAAILDHALKNIVTLVGGIVSMLALNVSLTTAVEESSDIDGEAAELPDADLDPVRD